MASPKRWDVWLVAADQVYRGVPTDVAAGWAAQGRLAATDKLRPTEQPAAPWVDARSVPGVGGFFPKTGGGAAAVPVYGGEGVVAPSRRGRVEDDEVDMIPLIDISLVLLVFFMMTTVVSTVSPVQTPAMRYAQELSPGGESVVFDITPWSGGEPQYALRIPASKSNPAYSSEPYFALPEALAKLDGLLANWSGPPPEVQVACDKSLSSDRVWAVTVELDRRQQTKKIRGYAAQVTERR